MIRTFSFVLLLFSISFFAQNSISGFVTAENSGEAIIGASVNISGTNSAVKTNEFGFYSISTNLQSGNLIVSASGFESISAPFEITSGQKINLKLPALGSEKEKEIEGVTITATKRLNKVNSALSGVEKLNIQTINKLPVLLGERDFVKSLQYLPGVKSGGEGQSGFSVRGGNLDQNMVLLDDAPVYNISHLMGFFSTFNSDAIKDVTFYKGSAPAQFGGRLSSVVDVKMNDGNNKKFGVSGGIGIIASRLNVEGPIQKEKSSFIISGRRTYADLFLKMDKEYKDNMLHFYDLNAKFNYKFTEKDQIFVSGYFGKDVLGIKNEFGLDWGNSTATVRYNRVLNDKWFSNTSMIYSNYNYNIDIKDNANPFKIKSNIKDYNFKQELQFSPNNENSWRFGANAIYHTIKPGEIFNNKTNNSDTERKNGFEMILYAGNDWKATENLKINYGVRLSSFSVLKGTYYELNDQKEVINTIKSDKTIKTYFNVEPRFSANYKLNENSSVKLAYARNTQNFHLINNSVATSPTDRWVMNTNIIKPEIADQISVGYVKNFKDDMYEFGGDIYYKSMKNQIDYKDNAQEAEPIIETQLLFGKGRAYGLEMLLRKNKGKFTGWMSYTLSKTEKLIEGVNNNTWYNSRYDRTHDFTVVGMYELTRKLSASALWTFQTGNAVTFPSGKYLINGEMLWYYTERNAYRMPPYHRLDVSLNWILSNKKRWKSELVFGVYNAYGRQNPYMIDFRQKPNSNETEVVQISLFRYVPSITYNFKF